MAFLQQTRFLGEKLGAVLIQLPPSLEFEPARARAFLSLLRDQYKGDVAWEPRHRSWFTKMADGLLREFSLPDRLPILHAYLLPHSPVGIQLSFTFVFTAPLGDTIRATMRYFSTELRARSRAWRVERAFGACSTIPLQG